MNTDDLRQLAEIMEWRDFPESHKKVRHAADLLDAKDALIAKYREALEQYANHANWALAYERSPDFDWCMLDGHGWEIAENTLKGDTSK